MSWRGNERPSKNPEPWEAQFFSDEQYVCRRDLSVEGERKSL